MSPLAANSGPLSFSFLTTHFVATLDGTAPDEATSVNVTGTVRLGCTLDIVNSVAFPEGTQFPIIVNDDTDAVISTFRNLPEGTIVRSLGVPQFFRISYVGRTGNDVVLTALGKPTTTVLLSSPNPSRLFEPVTLIITVSGGSTTPTGSVQLFDFSQPLGPQLHTVTLNAAGTASSSAVFLFTGEHILGALYSGDSVYAGSWSNIVVQIVGDPPPPRRRATRH